MIDETKIMQYADGTLPEDEKETLKKTIESDPQLQKLLKDYQATGEILFNLGKIYYQYLLIFFHIQRKVYGDQIKLF